LIRLFLEGSATLRDFTLAIVSRATALTIAAEFAYLTRTAETSSKQREQYSSWKKILLRSFKTLQETLFPNAAPQVLPLGQFGGLSLDDQAADWIHSFSGSICAALGWLQQPSMATFLTSSSIMPSRADFGK